MSNFCYHHQNLLQFNKITTPRIHVFWPCLKLQNWCFWSNSTLLSFCAPYRCKHECLWGICIYSNMEHIHERQARRSFCSRYRCKYNSPIFITLTKFWFYFHFYRKSRQEIHATFFFINGSFLNRSNATFQNTVSPCTIALIGLISELIKEFSRFCKHKIVIIKRTIVKILLI